MKYKFCLAILTVALINTSALAVPAQISVIRAGDNLVVQSDSQIRYQTDPITRKISFPEAILAPGAVIPEGVTWVKEDASIRLAIENGTTYALSPDGKSLILIPPGRQLIAPIPQDEREPFIYPVTYSDPSTLASMVQSVYPGTRIVVDQRQRALVVVANPADRQLIFNLIKQLDAGRPQVQFEAEIIEVNRDKTESLGIQYDSIFTFKLTEGEGIGLTKLGTINRNPLSLSLGLNLLKTNGAAKVLARPRITTIDGQEARINSTQTTPVITSTANGGTSVQSISTGISLRMTPKIAPDGTVETNLTISVSVPTATTSQGVPQFSTREANTTVRVANGEPIAIGGLLEDRNVSGEQKVPGLGDIPLLGQLFTTTRTDIHRSDLVIVVTPYLVMSVNDPLPIKAPAEMPALTPAVGGQGNQLQNVNETMVMPTNFNLPSTVPNSGLSGVDVPIINGLPQPQP